jgi:hypothetical protein
VSAPQDDRLGIFEHADLPERRDEKWEEGHGAEPSATARPQSAAIKIGRRRSRSTQTPTGRLKRMSPVIPLSPPAAMPTRSARSPSLTAFEGQS